MTTRPAAGPGSRGASTPSLGVISIIGRIYPSVERATAITGGPVESLEGPVLHLNETGRKRPGRNVMKAQVAGEWAEQRDPLANENGNDADGDLVGNGIIIVGEFLLQQ